MLNSRYIFPLVILPMCFLVIWIIIPYYHYKVNVIPVSIVCTVLMGMWAALFEESRKYIIKVWLLMLLYAGIYGFIPGGMDFHYSLIYLHQAAILFVPAAFARVILDNYRGKNIYWLLIICGICIVFVIWKTWSELAENPLIMRTLAQGGLDDEEIINYRLNNVGGINFAYCLPPIAFFFTLLFIKCKSLTRWVSLGIVVLIAFFDIESQYSALLFLFVAGIIVVIFKQSRSRFTKIAVLLGCIILYFSFIDICQWIADVSYEKYPDISWHFQDLVNGFTGQGFEDGRDTRAMDALDCFFKSPLWGTYDCLNPVNPDYENILHAHSGIASILGQSGLIGISVYSYYAYTLWKGIHDSIKNKGIDSFIYDISAIYFACYFAVNIAITSYEISNSVFLIIPMLIYCYNKWNRLSTLKDMKAKSLA